MNIEQLKNQNQWVNWIYRETKNGTTKVPISYKGQATGTNQKFKSTWTTFENAKNNKNADGVGLILTNGICGIDMDEKDIKDPIVQDLFNLMDTYTEYSPSGKGFHFLFKVDMQKLPTDIHKIYYQKNPHNKIECYISGLTNRFFTFTENVVIDKPINERTEQLLTFLDKYMQRPNTTIESESSENLENSCKYIIDIISKSEQAEKFENLYFKGDTTLYNNDDSSADMALCSILAFYCGEDFELIDKLFCESKLYREKWDRIDYKYKTIEKAINFCNGNFYKNSINFRLLEKLQKLTPEKRYTQNDIGMSELFSKIYKSQIRYNATNKNWYYFNGKVWIEDTGGMITLQKMKELSKTLITYGSSIVEDSVRETFVKFVNKLGDFTRREKIVKDSRDKMFISQAEFDKNTDLFNCQNGTFNLRTFQFTPHNPNDLLSKISNVVYDPKMTCPIFTKFINEVMQDKENKIKFLQIAFGYSLTADTSQETCFILYGSTTRNGKGTLTNTISYMLGDYARTAMPETLSEKKWKNSSGPSSDIARLNSCRFLNISEPSKRMMIDSALLKTLTGRDVITARHLHQTDFEFHPQFKLFINCNYLPIINDNTVFESDRINVITFDRHFEQHERDNTLKDKLKQQNEISGIFNWCLEGLKEYQANGLVIPADVIIATVNYQNSNDKFQIFFDEELIKSNKNISVADFYKRYKEWCEENGFIPQSKSTIIGKLKSRNLFRDRGTVNGVTKTNIIVGYEFRD